MIGKNSVCMMLVLSIIMLNTFNSYYIKMIYTSYSPKTYDGSSNLTAEDYHNLEFQYSGTDGTLTKSSADPTYSIVIQDTDTSVSVGMQSHPPYANILYTKLAYLPGIPQTHFSYIRTYPDNSTIQKYWVMYNFTLTCNSTIPTMTFRIKYFYCFQDARTFFNNADANLGSGSNTNKLIHNGQAIEATLVTNKFGDSGTVLDLKSLVEGAVTSC